MALNKIFVYGTLKQDHWNHQLIAHALYLGATTTKNPHFGLWSYGPDDVPFAYYKPEGGSRISGEVYEVDEPTLELVRYLEGFYDETSVPLADGNEAYMYLWDSPDAYMKTTNILANLPSKYNNYIDFPPTNGVITWPLITEAADENI